MEYAHVHNRSACKIVPTPAIPVASGARTACERHMSGMRSARCGALLAREQFVSGGARVASERHVSNTLAPTEPERLEKRNDSKEPHTTCVSACHVLKARRTSGRAMEWARIQERACRPSTPCWALEAWTALSQIDTSCGWLENRTPAHSRPARGVKNFRGHKHAQRRKTLPIGENERPFINAKNPTSSGAPGSMEGNSQNSNMFPQG